jgi:hypothetical protein
MGILRGVHDLLITFDMGSDKGMICIVKHTLLQIHLRLCHRHHTSTRTLTAAYTKNEMELSWDYRRCTEETRVCWSLAKYVSGHVFDRVAKLSLLRASRSLIRASCLRSGCSRANQIANKWPTESPYVFYAEYYSLSSLSESRIVPKWNLGPLTWILDTISMQPRTLMYFL